MEKYHSYKATVTWTGNNGTGTSDYAAYERSHTIQIEGKPDLPASSDAPFRGDVSKHNPEDMLLSALSSCHMLWYLHLCADAGIIVTDYRDEAVGTMVQTGKGGHFTEVVLHPVVKITDASKAEQALDLHEEAHRNCFIANSVNFPVKHAAVCVGG